ncbi:MAG: AMP-binding protein [Acidobacteriota bacterium]
MPSRIGGEFHRDEGDAMCAGERPAADPTAPSGLSYVPADASSPVLDTTVGGVLRAAAAEHPERLALVEALGGGEGRRWTYAELLADAERVARALASCFDKGERVAVWAPNVPEWVLLEYGAGLAGVVLVTVNPAYQAKELDYVLRQSRSAGVIYLPSFRGNPMEELIVQIQEDLPELRHVVSLADWEEFLDSVPPDQALPTVAPEDGVQIQYTSGTTGFPKGASLHHRGLTNNARHVAERLQIEADSVYVNPMPLFHTGGCVIGVLGPVQARATLVLPPLFDPALMLETVERERATHMLGVPTMLIAMMEQPDFASRDLGSLQFICSGGSTVPADLVRRIEEQLGVQFSIIYGQTEASPGITLMKPDDMPHDKSETLGPVLPQIEMKVIDPESGDTVPYGVAGELCARGYMVMNGYFEMPDKTGETIDAEGWLHTGDLVTMDERGYTTITGRLKDMIIRGGENLYPREIEELLFQHEGVADVAVVGLPDAKFGEIVAAFVRDADPADPVSDAELHTYCREHLSPQKTPKHWFHVSEFPLTPSGKIQKYVLVEHWEKGLFG